MSDAADDPIGIALLVAKAIDEVGGEYFVGGSVASSLQGDPRTTNDIDFVLALRAGLVPAFAAALGNDFEIDQDILREALNGGPTANGFYLPHLTKLDFFSRGPAPFDDMEFSRRRRVLVRQSGETLWIKSPEDTIIRKLLWYRQGGEVSERQWRDVTSVVRVNRDTLDGAYLSLWAARLRCQDLLQRALA